MANWKYRIDVADIWQQYPDEIDFLDFKTQLLDILKNAVEDLRDIIDDEDEIMSLEDIVNGLEYSDDEEEFDQAWQDLYDWADYNKVWIATF